MGTLGRDPMHHNTMSRSNINALLADERSHPDRDEDIGDFDADQAGDVDVLPGFHRLAEQRRAASIRRADDFAHGRKQTHTVDAVENAGVGLGEPHPSGCGNQPTPATPISVPSGSLKWPTMSPFGDVAGPITRVPPRLSAR